MFCKRLVNRITIRKEPSSCGWLDSGVSNTKALKLSLGAFLFLNGEQLAKLHSEHHIAFRCESAAHKGLHTIGFTTGNFFKSITVHNKRDVCIGCITRLY